MRAIAPINVRNVDPNENVADLQISKDAVAGRPVAGQQYSYIIHLFNLGPDTAENVRFVDSPPSNTAFHSFVQNSGPAFTCATSAGITTCDGADLARGQSAFFTATYTVNSSIPDGAEISDTLEVTSDTEERRSEDNETSQSDSAGNPSPPACTIACPGNITQQAAEGDSGATVTFDLPTPVGSCGSGPATALPASGSFFGIGATNVTITAADGVTTCSFVVTVTPATDEEPPSISCPSDISVPESSSSADSATVSYTVTATDNSGTATVDCAPASGSIFPTGQTHVTCTAFDPSGNSASCDFNVEVTEVACTPEGPPTPNVATLPTITRTCSVTLLATDAPRATDSCGTTIVATTTDPLSYTTPGTYTIDWTYTDSAGNTSTQPQTVVLLEDTTAPVPDAPSLPTVTGTCSATVTDVPTASDNCDGENIVGTTGDALTYTTPGTDTITWTFTDAEGNASTQTQSVVVIDNTPPTLTVNGPSSVTVECHTSYTDAGASASDNCAGDLTGSITVNNPVNVNVPGTYTVTYSVTDGANPVTATRTVNVVDTHAPTVALNGPSSVTVECHAAFNDPGVTASDTCDGNVTVTTSGGLNVNVPGTYTVTYTAADDSGNTASVSRTVVVVDTTAPVITLAGANPMTVECHTAYVEPGATAADACDSSVPVNVSGVVNVNVPGTYTRTYTATDDSGNTTTRTRTVNVVDTTAPTLTLNGQSYEMWPPNHKYKTFTVTNFVTGASDGCDSGVDLSDVRISKVTSDEAENSGGDGNTLNDIVIAADCKSVQLRSERDGGGNGRVYTITFRVRDAAGNTTTKTAKVTVPKNQNGSAAVDNGPVYTVNAGCP